MSISLDTFITLLLRVNSGHASQRKFITIFTTLRDRRTEIMHIKLLSPHSRHLCQKFTYYILWNTLKSYLWTMWVSEKKFMAKMKCFSMNHVISRFFFSSVVILSYFVVIFSCLLCQKEENMGVCKIGR